MSLAEMTPFQCVQKHNLKDLKPIKTPDTVFAAIQRWNYFFILQNHFALLNKIVF